MKQTYMKPLIIGALLILTFLQVRYAPAQTAACPTLPAHTGSATSTVNISEGATYKVWTRMMVPNTKHNSYWLQIDDTCGINVGDSDTITPNTWTWVAYNDGDTTQTITRDLAQGVHTVKLVGREPNVKIDRLVFAKDLSCIPVDTGTNCAPGATPTPDPVTSALGTIADTYVASDTPRGNFGTQARFFVDNRPTKITYLKFDLSSLAGKSVVSAKLKLKIANNGSTGSQILKPVTNTSWSETDITYNNRPGITNTTLATIPGGSADTVREVDLTAYVSQKAGTIMSLGITSSSANDVNFYSREASTASDRPVLTVTVE